MRFLKKIGQIIGKLIKFVLIVLLVLLLILLGLFIFYPATEAVKQITQYSLMLYGVNNPHVNVTKVTSNQLVIESIDLGDAQNFNLKKLIFDYSLSFLLDRKIKQINIGELNFNGVADSNHHDKLSFGQLDKIIYHAKSKYSNNFLSAFTVENFNINKSDIILNKDEQKLIIPFVLHTDHTTNAMDVNKTSNIYNSKLDFSDADINLINYNIPSVGKITFVSKLSGTLPFTISNKKIKFQQGSIFSNQNGVIKFEPYTIPANQDEKSAQLYKLFSNFQYKDLNAKISMDDSEIIWFSFSFTGSNQDFYNGTAVNLNVNMKIEAHDLIKYARIMLNLKSDEINELLSEK